MCVSGLACVHVCVRLCANLRACPYVYASLHVFECVRASLRTCVQACVRTCVQAWVCAFELACVNVYNVPKALVSHMALSSHQRECVSLV